MAGRRQTLTWTMAGGSCRARRSGEVLRTRYLHEVPCRTRAGLFWQGAPWNPTNRGPTGRTSRVQWLVLGGSARTVQGSRQLCGNCKVLPPPCTLPHLAVPGRGANHAKHQQHAGLGSHCVPAVLRVKARGYFVVRRMLHETGDPRFGTRHLFGMG